MMCVRTFAPPAPRPRPDAWRVVVEVIPRRDSTRDPRRRKSRDLKIAADVNGVYDALTEAAARETMRTVDFELRETAAPYTIELYLGDDLVERITSAGKDRAKDRSP